MRMFPIKGVLGAVGIEASDVGFAARKHISVRSKSPLSMITQRNLRYYELIYPLIPPLSTFDSVIPHPQASWATIGQRPLLLSIVHSLLCEWNVESVPFPMLMFYVCRY